MADTVRSIELLPTPDTRTLHAFDCPPALPVREARLLDECPWVRSLGKLTMEVSIQGWRFPNPTQEESSWQSAEGNNDDILTLGLPTHAIPDCPRPIAHCVPPTRQPQTRLKPTNDTVMLKDRLLYVLQPPLESLFDGKQVHLPLQPYPYQLQGIAFLMPRHAALLADEMGLGKTAQVLLALRLLFHSGMIHRALVVCPKSLVFNWTRELRLWADDIPYEVIGGEANERRTSWHVSNCPLKLVNYELLTRDAELATDERVHFDVVVLDEAQRIKTRESKTAQIARRLKRSRSWAMTGTPIENRTEDLVNLFAFLDPERIPRETPARRLPEFTADCILRRTKEEVAPDMPTKTERDAYLELTPAQRAAYNLAETQGVIRLNELDETISVHHVFELVMRLKQICNFDPITGASAKLERLLADLDEVADSGRKAIVFSQWVQPLERMAIALADFGPLLYHGRVPYQDRQPTLERFKNDPDKHVLLMSYGTGSVGLNLQFANYVFLFDRWWNPAVEDQAINRTHRVGQREPVFVTRFMTPGTIEERIAAILERKRQLFDELIAANAPPSARGLTEEEIFGLFRIRARPRRLAG